MGRVFRVSLVGISSIGVLLGCVFIYGGVKGKRTQPPTAATRATNNKEVVAKASLVQNYGRLPLLFEPNVGQTDPAVKFLSRGRGYTLFLTPTEAVLTVAKSKGQPDSLATSGLPLPERERAGVRVDRPGAGLPDLLKSATVAEPSGSADHAADKVEVLRMKFLGSNPSPKSEGLGEQPTKINYFIGNDPAKWHTNVQTYTKVKYESVYPGIDLVFYGNQHGQLEYDFVIAPGADPNQIKLSFDGPKRLDVNASGELVLHMHDGQVRFRKPKVHQAGGGPERLVVGDYLVGEETEHSGGKIEEVAFHFGAYDLRQPLVVDPVLEYSTYLGGGECRPRTGNCSG